MIQLIFASNGTRSQEIISMTIIKRKGKTLCNYDYWHYVIDDQCRRRNGVGWGPLAKVRKHQTFK